MTVMDIVMATGNRDKVREIQEMLTGSSFHIISMKESGFTGNIVEDGDSFEANALIKARAVWNFTGGVVIADDSGLCIDYLGGEPGIYSARFLGEDTPYEVKNAEFIRRLEGASGKERSARFICAMAVIFPDGSSRVFKGAMEGEIAYEPKGTNGFGYDPILYLPDRGCTSAELPPAEKNLISHRGKALRQVGECLSEFEKNKN